jgi:glycosyltransferase involved in cell wall biosynthesis
MINSSEPLVSICMSTYNHEAYIRQAIGSILMQQCDFQYELVIGEDCSQDNTFNICLEYAAKHPEIKLLSLNANIGMVKNFVRTLQACSGKYIALCEGDDYWTDPCKLQKQVDFLEKNFDFVLVGHPSQVICENNKKAPDIYHSIKNDVLNKRDVISSYLLQASSVVFRRDVFNKIDVSGIRVEHSLYILLVQYGKFKIIPEMMSVYRIHGKGASGTSTPQKAYPGQLDWIKNLKRVMGRNFFWGYHFLSSKVHVHYAIRYPEVFTKGILFKYFYFFKFAILMLLLYPRNIKSVFSMIPKLVKTPND